MTEKVKNVNRTLLEMWTGIVFLGLVCQGAGAFLAKDQVRYAGSLWFGILLASVSVFHMYRTLDRALALDEEAASKAIFRGYMTRYVCLIAILGIIMLTDVLNPLIVFMAYMSLKVTALMQPLTHKFYNAVFHETDPEPTPLEEENSAGAPSVTLEGGEGAVSGAAQETE